MRVATCALTFLNENVYINDEHFKNVNKHAHFHRGGFMFLLKSERKINFRKFRAEINNHEGCSERY